MTEIQLETILDSLKNIQYFNSIDLEDVELSFENNVVYIPKRLIKRWKYIGLDNIELIKNIDRENLVEHFEALEHDVL